MSDTNHDPNPPPSLRERVDVLEESVAALELEFSTLSQQHVRLQAQLDVLIGVFAPIADRIHLRERLEELGLQPGAVFHSFPDEGEAWSPFSVDSPAFSEIRRKEIERTLGKLRAVIGYLHVVPPSED